MDAESMRWMRYVWSRSLVRPDLLAGCPAASSFSSADVLDARLTRDSILFVHQYDIFILGAYVIDAIVSLCRSCRCWSSNQRE